MEPVDPRRERRFWNVEPSRLSERVFWRDAAVFTGEAGEIHPSPVPCEPGGWKVLRDVATLWGGDERWKDVVVRGTRRRSVAVGFILMLAVYLDRVVGV